jgi:hypothetical protein
MACTKIWEYTEGRLYLNCHYVMTADGTSKPIEAEYLAMWLDENQPNVNHNLKHALVGLSGEQAFYVLRKTVNRFYPNWNADFIVSQRPMFKAMTTASAFAGMTSWLDD